MAQRASIESPGTSPLRSTTDPARDRLDRYFELSTILLLTSGFLTIASTGALDIFSVAIVAAALLLRSSAFFSRRSLTAPPSWDPYFTFGYIAFYAIDYFLLTRSFVTATVHLVLFSMVVKLFSVRRDRDYVYLTVLAFTEVLAASVLTVDSVFLVAFAIFTLLAVNTFVAFEIRRSWAASSAAQTSVETGNNHLAPQLTRSLSGAALQLVIAILLVGSALFFVLPRMTGGYFSRFVPRNGIETGFSENVRLGQIGDIQQSSAVAMHIEIAGDETGIHDLKWRGVSLAYFDGREWSNRLSRIPAENELPGCFDVVNSIERRRNFVCTPHLQLPDRLRYRVLMEPIGTSIFFLAPKPESLTGNYREVVVDESGSVFNADLRRPIQLYEATSDIAVPDPEQLRHAADFYSSVIAETYLQLPPTDPRIPELALQITGSSKTRYDKAAVVENYLRTNLAYTLQQPSTSPRDPIAHFLFERKMGHCEYFASSMTVMLRTLGIPSRIVNGFRGGEFNPVNHKYIIRARDAHSWVEAYFPGYGWVAFDPTPASLAPNAVDHNSLTLYLDAMRDFWREWIINYDVGHQRTLGDTGLATVTTSIERSRRWFRLHYVDLLLRAFDFRNKVARKPTRWIYGSLACIVAFLFLLNIGRIRRAIVARRLTRSPEKAAQAAASLWYRRMARVVEKRGFRKEQSQTPGEFLELITDEKLHSSVAAFTLHYERARFADSPDDASRLPNLFEAVKVAAKTKK